MGSNPGSTTSQLGLYCAQQVSSIQLFVIPWTEPHQAPPSMELSRQEYWSGLPFPPPWNLPNPGIEPASLVSPALTGGFFTTGAPGKPSWVYRQSIKWSLKASSSLTLRAVSMIETGHSINYFVVIYKEMPCLL